MPINETKWDADTLARQPFVVEQEGDERILRRYTAVDFDGVTYWIR